MDKEQKEIIEGCKAGKRKWQDKLYSQYSSMLFGICLRYTNDYASAQDVLQDGLVKIYKHISTYSGDYSFIAWMKRVMINTAITHYRKNLKHAYHSDVQEVQVESNSDATLTKSEFTKEELLNTINELPKGYKMVFQLYIIEGYKHKEIAEMLGVDINTSKSQLSRARKLLQTKLIALKEYRILE